MSDHWEYFPCAMGDDQAFIFVDMGARDLIDAEAPPLLVRIRLAYKEPHPNGLPKSAEFEPVSAIEDRIQVFAKESSSDYVGRVTVGGHRFFYVYTSAAEAMWTSLVSNLAEEVGYTITAKFRHDPEHRGYWDDLYPSPDDWQVIKDIHVLEALAENGDDGSTPRKIDHWIYFGSEAAAGPFISWACTNNFVHETEFSELLEDGRYCIRLSHQCTLILADISHHTIALRRAAAEHGGEYDGWEAPVMKTSDQS